MKSKQQVALIILDGWGHREETEHNAIASAKKPIFDSLWSKYPRTLLEASGLAVGLPEGQMGNSEIGHMTIGAGSVIDTDLVRIGKAVFEENEAFANLCAHSKKYDSHLHIMGLLSNGGVHSHIDHLFLLLKAAKYRGVKKIIIHAFTDGRDTPPQSAADFMETLETFIFENDIPAVIATVSGRYYAMDRDNNWDRLDKTLSAIFKAEGRRSVSAKPSEEIRKVYESGGLDEHLEPIVVHASEIGQNDSVFIFNFRSDRVRMLTQKIIEKTRAYNLLVGTMTEYSEEFKVLVAFPPKKITSTLAEKISSAGLSQVHIAETEKFPHATYFLNGGREEPHKGETHILLPSRKDVRTHDEAPEMKAREIADAAIAEINKGVDFIFINFANPDMVGHTANVPAIIKAVETVDRELGRVLFALSQRGGIAFITADHGNAEVNFDPDGGVAHTAHTLNLVPAIVTKDNFNFLNKKGGLADIAPTVLNILGLDSSGMSGKNLF